MKLTILFSIISLLGLALLSGCSKDEDFSGSTAKALDVKFGSGFVNEKLRDISIDVNGNIYVTSKTRLYKLDEFGAATVLAGGNTSAVVDGQGSGASFKTIGLISTDKHGNIYAVDSLAIRKISPTGVVETVQINKTDDGVVDVGMPVKPFNRGLVEMDGALYLAYSNLIVKIEAGEIIVYAGNRYESGFGDGTATTAKFYGAQTLILDAAEENFIVADAASLRKISLSDTTVTTLTGGPTFGKADGPLSEATFQGIDDVVGDNAGNYYLSTLNTIRKVSVTGQVSTIAGPIKSDGGAFMAGGLALDPEDKFLYVVDMDQPASIVKIDLSKL